MHGKELFKGEYYLQVNLFQEHSFLHQLTHNMTRDFSLNSPKNTSSQHDEYKYCFECQNKTKQKNNSRMRASEKDLPVKVH